MPFIPACAKWFHHNRFQGFDIPVAGKTGTAQQTGHANHGLFVGYRHMMIRKLPSQYELPTVTVRIMRQLRQEM